MMMIHLMNANDRRLPDGPVDRDPRPSSLRSCLTCAKAKAKCERKANQRICERCARLKKECPIREPTLRRKRTAKGSRSAQLEKLESKIEHLVNALAANQAQKVPSPDISTTYQPSPPQSLDFERLGQSESQTSNTYDESRKSSDSLNFTPGGTDDRASAAPANPTPTSMLSLTVSGSGRREWDAQTMGVSEVEAEILLDRYRRLMADGFLFVRIDPDVTAFELYAQKPLLLHAIVTVSYFHNLTRQRQLAKGLMADISQRVIIDGEKSVEIVQGILVFSAWYHPHFNWCQQIFNVLNLASAIVAAMGIDRLIYACPSHCSGTVSKNAQNPESRRVLAGLYYVTAMMSTFFRKSDAIPYSDALVNALSTLEAEKEYDDDLFLVQMVRIQHIAEQTIHIKPTSTTAPMYSQALATDLSRLRQNDRSPDPNNRYLQLQYLNTEVFIHKLALNALQTVSPSTLTPHLPSLEACISSLKNLFKVFFLAFESASYLTFPFAAFAHYAHAFFLLYRFYALDLPGWSPTHLQAELPFAAIADAGADRFEASSRSAPDGLMVDNDTFGKWAERARLHKRSFEGSVAEGSTCGDGSTCGEGTDGAAVGSPGLVSAPARESGAADSDGVAPAKGLEAQQQRPQRQPQQPLPLDEYLSEDFFAYLNDNDWQGFGADIDFGIAEMAMV